MGVARLRMTPLTQETIHSLILPEVLTDRVAFGSMSVHAIPSFPEKSYGYLDCERGVADGIKNMLNGGLFQAVKVRVGRPDTFVPRGVPSEEVEGEKKKRKRAKKDSDDDRKKAKKKSNEKEVVNGIEVRDRKV